MPHKVTDVAQVFTGEPTFTFTLSDGSVVASAPIVRDGEADEAWYLASDDTFTDVMEITHTDAVAMIKSCGRPVRKLSQGAYKRRRTHALAA